MLSDKRRWYAEEVALRAGSDSQLLLEAFAAVPREHYLGPPPWSVLRSTPVPVPPLLVSEPGMLYHCVLVVIDAEQKLNNGEPSSLALWIDALDVKHGEHVVHLGCGVGYYTAILAEMVGSSGRVTAIEVDPALAKRATENLKGYQNVEVLSADGAAVPEADAMFINAGCTHPRAEWLAQLREGGRICIPLTADNSGGGVMMRLKRVSGEWEARVVSPVRIFPCHGARDPSEAEAILGFLRLGQEGILQVRFMRMDAHDRGPDCLLHGARYCLSSSPATSR